MTFYLLRHGATKGNLERRYVGGTDEPLLPEAREALMRRKLPEVARAYASPLRRAVATARLLWPDVPVETVDGFRECDFGRFEFLRYEDLKDDPHYQAWLASRGQTGFPGGETRADFSRRVVSAFDRVAAEAEKCPGDAAIVAHGGTLMAILEARALPRKDFYAYQVQNGGGFADGVEGKEIDQVVIAEYFLITVGPSEAHQIVDQRFGKEPHILIGHDRGGAVPFAEASLVRA